MKNKFLKAALVSCFLALGSYAHATIIDNGDYTTDTSSGLDWLDWEITDNQTGTDALETNAGWRYATALESYAMLDAMGFGLGGEGQTNYGGGYHVQYNTFASLFGETWDNEDGFGVQAQVLGAGMFGVVRSPHGDDDTTVYKGIWSNEFDTTSADDSMGIALVRSSVAVPEPSTLAIFALGLMGLASRRFKRKS